MKVDIEIFAVDGYIHDAIKSRLQALMADSAIEYTIHHVDDINEFIDEGLESVPTIRVNYTKRFTKSESSNLDELASAVHDYIMHQTVKTIVCPVDFSEHSLNALHWAHQFAAHYGMRLKITHVYLPVTEPQYAAPFDTHTHLQKLRLELQKIADTLQNAYPQSTEIEIEVDVGEPIHRITQYSREVSTSMIVMGTHGASGLLNKILGSISATVAQHAHTPVVLVPAGIRYHKPENVLVAFHQEFLSNGQLKLLTELNHRWLAHIDFVHVHDHSDDYTWLKQKLLERLTTPALPEFSFEIHEIATGSKSVMDSLLKYANREHPDLIVLVTRNRSYLRSLLKPGVTKELTLRTEWPLLVMHEA